MDSKFFDIPFLTRSSQSDFICKDGELAYAKGILGIIPDDYPEDLPPSPEITFALSRATLAGWHLLPEIYPSQTLPATTPGLEYWTPLAAQLLSQFCNEAQLRNLFVAPFFVMAAWKTYDGQYLSCSKPQILIPNSSIPIVATNGDINGRELELKVVAAVGNLCFKIQPPETLRDWVGKIESLVIFVSHPLLRYDTYNAFLPYRRITTDNTTICLDRDTGDISEKRISTDTFEIGWKANLIGACNLDSEVSYEDLRFMPFVSLPFEEIDLPAVWTPVTSGNIGLKFINGYYTELDYKELSRPTISTKSDKFIVEGEDEEIHLITRPIKLTGAIRLKRVSRVYLRGEYTPTGITMTVWGSRDLLNWWHISTRKGGTVAGLPLTSFRFYKVEISGYLASGENLQGLSCII